MPELPNSLLYLYCYNNILSSLPELPNLLKYFWCYSNNIFGLPELPNSLKILYCNENYLTSLPELPNSKIYIRFYDNPIYTHIQKYFNGETKKYFEYKIKLQRIFANKIGNWFLDCKYNPKYLYCRKRLMKEYDELYN